MKVGLLLVYPDTGVADRDQEIKLEGVQRLFKTGTKSVYISVIHPCKDRAKQLRHVPKLIQINIQSNGFS